MKESQSTRGGVVTRRTGRVIVIPEGKGISKEPSVICKLGHIPPKVTRVTVRRVVYETIGSRIIQDCREGSPRVPKPSVYLYNEGECHSPQYGRYSKHYAGIVSLELGDSGCEPTVEVNDDGTFASLSISARCGHL